MKELKSMEMAELAAFFFWDDLQSLEQAKMVAMDNDIDLDEVRRWSEAQGYLNKFEDFHGVLK